MAASRRLRVKILEIQGQNPPVPLPLFELRGRHQDLLVVLTEAVGHSSYSAESLIRSQADINLCYPTRRKDLRLLPVRRSGFVNVGFDTTRLFYYGYRSSVGFIFAIRACGCPEDVPFGQWPLLYVTLDQDRAQFRIKPNAQVDADAIERAAEHARRMARTAADYLFVVDGFTASENRVP